MVDSSIQRKIYIEGAKLKLYVNDLKKQLEQLQHAPFWDRNPYIRSNQAKKHLQALNQSVEQCVDALLSYTALLSTSGLCAKKELHAYFFMYDFLFQFHDDIIRQEYAHRLLTRDVELTSRFHEFFRYSEQFIANQEKKYKILANDETEMLYNKR